MGPNLPTLGKAGTAAPCAPRQSKFPMLSVRIQYCHRHRPKPATGRQTTNFYTLTVPPLINRAVQHVHPRGAPDSPIAVQHVHPPSVHHVHPNLPDRKELTEYGEQFEIFWRSYPQIRRGRKDYTLQAWQEAISRAAPATILAGLRRFKFPADPTEVPYASRWLTADGWVAPTLQPPPPYPPPSRPRTAAGHELTLDDLAESGL